MTPLQIREILRDWRLWARLDQLPPEGKAWRRWLILGGRGSGKTRTGSEWVRGLAVNVQARRIALVGPTFSEARLVMIEGQSGLLSVHGDDERPVFEPSKRTLTWPNGCVAHVFSAEEPDGLRGPQFDAAWCDELAKWKQAENVWNMLQFALRLGENPLAVITTTPRPIALVKALLVDEATVTTRSTTFDNASSLAPAFIKDVTERYAGSRLGRQELNGELIDDDPDALFKRDIIDKYRRAALEKYERIVIAVDPPAGFGKTNNACGIVCAAIDQTGDVFVLSDRSVHGARPIQWARRIVEEARRWPGALVVAEINQGGAMVEQVLRQVDRGLNFLAVRATLGKKARAEPVAALYEQGRVHHVGAFAELEDEMCAAIGEGQHSPDRLDALVWAVTELVLRPHRKKAEPRVRML